MDGGKEKEKEEDDDDGDSDFPYWPQMILKLI